MEVYPLLSQDSLSSCDKKKKKKNYLILQLDVYPLLCLD